MGAAKSSSLPLPGCDAAPGIRRAITERLSGEEFGGLTFDEQMARRYQVLDQLTAKYPRELEPQRLLIKWTWWYDQDRYPELMERYRREAEQHPNDPLALYFAGQVLGSPDAEQSIRYLERAKVEAPNFPWPALELAHTYLAGKTLNREKAAENIKTFFEACPTPESDTGAYFLLSRAGSRELQARVASILRARLAHETDPYKLRDYQVLWSLEFRTRPVQEHEQERKQVSEDLARLESIAFAKQKPNVGLLWIMRNGYKDAGSPPAKIAAIENRILGIPSHNDVALMIVEEHWRKSHPEPADQQDRPAWASYDAAWVEAVRDWQRRFPENHEAAHRLLFSTIKDEPGLTEQAGIAALDDYIADVTRYSEPDSGYYLSAAEFLVDHKWQAERALGFARTAQEIAARDQANEDALDKNVTAQGLKDRAEQRLREGQQLNGVLLRAALLTGRTEAAQSIRSAVEADPPKDPKLESGYWLNRARLAEFDRRRADALAYYQKALYSRAEPPKPFHGKLKDDLSEEAHTFWNRMGGTEAAWAVWSKPPANRLRELADGRWERPTKTMPSFELVDLAGKTWRLQNLEGKTVLINVWATWCGHCIAELPKLEKLYEQTKGNPEVQILTFNVDDDPGLALPFVKEHGYTFPVLPASDLVNRLLGSVGIPQNWIVDRSGVWRWTQMGYNAADSNWSQDIQQKVSSTRN